MLTFGHGDEPIKYNIQRPNNRFLPAITVHPRGEDAWLLRAKIKREGILLKSLEGLINYCLTGNLICTKFTVYSTNSML